MAFGTVDEELRVLLTLDNEDYSRKMRASGRMARDLDRDLAGLYSTMQAGAGAAKTFLGTLLAIDAAIIGAGMAASRRAADFESLELSLAAVEGGANKAKSALEELRNIARGPGLGIPEAIQTFTGLRRGGIDREMAMALTRELGNAVASSGGGKDVLGRAGLALSQIALKPFLQGDELLQLSEAGIPGHRIIKDAFGTSDTEELKKQGITSTQVLTELRKALEKMPRVAGGARNSIDNFMDALDQGVIAIGRGINQVLMPEVDGFGRSLEKLTESGGLEEFGKTITNQWLDMFEAIAGGVGTSKDIMIEFMRVVLVAGYATKNFAMQIDDLINLLVPPIARKMFGRLTQSEGLDPLSLANRDIQGIEKIMELREQQRKRAKPAEIMEEQKPEAKPPSQEPVRLLSAIEKNTRTVVERLEDMLLGAGAATNAAFNQRNLNHWSGGGQGSGWRKVQEGLMEMFGANQTSMARAGMIGRSRG